MTMLRNLVAPLVLIASISPAWAGELSLAQISAYLNGLKEAQAQFTQQNADGTVSHGTVYIRRPGRMRFEYAPPNKTLVIASGGAVAVFDPKSNEPPSQYPLSSTPLNLILARNINLSQAGMVVGKQAQGNDTVVIAQDPKHPEYGRIALVFSDNPVALRQWIVTDASGQRTQVTLSALKPVSQLGDSMFDITVAAQQRRNR